MGGNAGQGAFGSFAAGNPVRFHAPDGSGYAFLADRVLDGGKRELNDYLGFLKAGCSKDPLDLLRDAGVDMEKPTAVDSALDRFSQLVAALDRLIH